MVICKLIEMTFESIPGGLAQAIFLLNGGDWATAAVVSVGLSCVCTAFIASTLVYDYDTDPTRRKRNPEFYGYIPDNKRALVFALLFLYHAVWDTMGYDRTRRRQRPRGVPCTGYNAWRMVHGSR